MMKKENECYNGSGGGGRTLSAGPVAPLAACSQAHPTNPPTIAHPRMMECVSTITRQRQGKGK